MKKGILLSLLAVILLAVVVCAIWYINEEGKMRAGSKDSFIPYNSAVVVTINAGAELAPEIRQAFAADLKVFRRKLLVRITDTLQQQGLVKAHPYVVAARTGEGGDEGGMDVQNGVGVGLHQLFGEDDHAARQNYQINVQRL